MLAEHFLAGDQVHHHWDNRLDPLLTIASGDSVSLRAPMSASGVVYPGARYEDIDLNPDVAYQLVGPIAIDGAQPGDTLQVDILELTPGDWGWAVILPGAGLLPEDFPDPHIRHFDLRSKSTTELVPGVDIPIEPSLGTMGTAPDDPTTASVFPPHKGGGNMDVRHLRAGSTLWLPVWCEGALFSCGDAHAAQGDGEVCVSGIECDVDAVLRFRLHKHTISGPRFFVPGPLTPRADASGYLATMGIDPDLHEGARTAVRSMIELLGEEYGLDPLDAYILCSLAGDLKILEMVNVGVWNVGFTMPRRVLPDAAGAVMGK